jgi:hypothetical protein
VQAFYQKLCKNHAPIAIFSSNYYLIIQLNISFFSKPYLITKNSVNKAEYMNKSRKFILMTIYLAALFLVLRQGAFAAISGKDLGEDADEVIEKTKENPQIDKEAAKKELISAIKLYQSALNSYYNGDRAKAKEYYTQALTALSGMDIDLSMQGNVVRDYKNIFHRIDDFLKEKQDTAAGPVASAASQSAIPLDTDNDLVKKYLAVYTEGSTKKQIENALNRSGKYREMIFKILAEYQLPKELVYLPVVESLYINNSRSKAGAVGLWQLMPGTARILGLKVNYWIDERKDPEKATRAACAYLKDLYLTYDDWHLAIAGYNRGEYGLSRDLMFSKATNITQMSKRNAVPSETENYVPQFIVAALIGQNPEKYGFNIQYASAPACDEVFVNNVIDLKVAAECAGTDDDTLRELNPQIKAWCTPHNYRDFKFHLPGGTKDRFLEEIAKVKELNPSRGFIKYRVKKGDCLGKIAKKFGTNVLSIKKDNNLKNSEKLQINQVLVVRPGREYLAKSN